VANIFLISHLPFRGLVTNAFAAMASIGSFIFPANGFEAVIFDCDGTLVDSMPAHFDAWCEALSLYGACGVFKEDVFFAMGGRPTRDIVVELNDEYNLCLDPEEVAFAKREAFLKRLHTVTLIEEVAVFAESLRGKVPMAIASGGTRMVIEKTLRAVGISDWFDEVITADDVADGKPAPDVFLHAARLLGVNPAKCLALDDAPSGILAARRAGMQVLAVPSPLTSSLA
jgi:HAD superfamily hydrolase (TIGR01549 family)